MSSEDAPFIECQMNFHVFPTFVILSSVYNNKVLVLLIFSCLIALLKVLFTFEVLQLLSSF